MLLQIKLSSYLKFKITNSVRVDGCFIRISDCRIRTFQSFSANNRNRGGVETGAPCAPPWTKYVIITTVLQVFQCSYVLNAVNTAVRNGFNMFRGGGGSLG